jgi:CBS domain-containing protein
MLLADLLREKDGGVVCTSPGARISETIGLMRRHGLGSIVVQDRRGHFLGLVSERDIVRGMAEQPDLLRAPAWVRMLENTLVGRPGDSVADTFEAMHRRRARHVPVLDAGRTVGVVSVGDILQARLRRQDSASDCATGAGDGMSVSLADVLGRKTGRIVTVSREDTMRRAITLMNRERVGAVLAADGNRQLLGMVTERNVAMALADHGDGLLAMPVAQFMGADFAVGHPQDDMRQALETLVRTHSRHLPVVTEGQILGIVSIGDIAAAQMTGWCSQAATPQIAA